MSKKAEKQWNAYQDGVDGEIRDGEGPGHAGSNNQRPHPAVPVQQQGNKPGTRRSGNENSSQAKRSKRDDRSKSGARQNRNRDRTSRPDPTAAPVLGPNGEKWNHCYAYNNHLRNPKTFRECPYKEKCTFRHEKAPPGLVEIWKVKPPCAALTIQPRTENPHEYIDGSASAVPRRAATPATTARTGKGTSRTPRSPARAPRTDSQSSRSQSTRGSRAGGSSRGASSTGDRRGAKGKGREQRNRDSTAQRPERGARSPSRQTNKSTVKKPPYYCRDFYAGNCTNGDCKFPHHDRATADRMVAAGTARRPPEKGSGGPRAARS